MSALNLRVKTMPCVKTFLEVTDANVNPDILDETAKVVSFVRLTSFIRNNNFYLALIFFFLIISLPRYRLSLEVPQWSIIIIVYLRIFCDVLFTEYHITFTYY